MLDGFREKREEWLAPLASFTSFMAVLRISSRLNPPNPCTKFGDTSFAEYGGNMGRYLVWAAEAA